MILGLLLIYRIHFINPFFNFTKFTVLIFETYFLLIVLLISPNTNGIDARINTGIHSQVRDTTSKSSVKIGTYITTKSRAKDRITALIRCGFDPKPNSFKVYFVLLTEKALKSSDVIKVANTMVWAPSIEPGKIHFRPII